MEQEKDEMWNIRAIFNEETALLPIRRRGGRRGSAFFVIKYLQAAAFTHIQRAEHVSVCVCEVGREQSAGGSVEESSRLHWFSDCCLSYPVCVFVCVLWSVYLLGLLAAWDGSDCFPNPLDLLSLSFLTTTTPSPPSLPPTHRGSSHRPHDERGGPPVSSPVLYMRRDSITSTSTPRRAQTHPQRLLWGL